ncbi:hypothetical protein CBM2606_A30427 [Cupriavidus taiwanensis]|nr:hypothetical protein CBM2606_A30427 [Cupriavidus taiwanensis]
MPCAPLPMPRRTPPRPPRRPCRQAPMPPSAEPAPFAFPCPPHWMPQLAASAPGAVGGKGNIAQRRRRSGEPGRGAVDKAGHARQPAVGRHRGKVGADHQRGFAGGAQLPGKAQVLPVRIDRAHAGKAETRKLRLHRGDHRVDAGMAVAPHQRIDIASRFRPRRRDQLAPARGIGLVPGCEVAVGKRGGVFSLRGLGDSGHGILLGVGWSGSGGLASGHGCMIGAGARRRDYRGGYRRQIGGLIGGRSARHAAARTGPLAPELRPLPKNRPRHQRQVTPNLPPVLPMATRLSSLHCPYAGRQSVRAFRGACRRARRSRRLLPTRIAPPLPRSRP